MNKKYARQIRMGIAMARDIEWGDYFMAVAAQREMLMLKAFMRERGNMLKEGTTRV